MKRSNGCIHCTMIVPNMSKAGTSTATWLQSSKFASPTAYFLQPPYLIAGSLWAWDLKVKGSNWAGSCIHVCIFQGVQCLRCNSTSKYARVVYWLRSSTPCTSSTCCTQTCSRQLRCYRPANFDSKIWWDCFRLYFGSWWYLILGRSTMIYRPDIIPLNSWCCYNSYKFIHLRDLNYSAWNVTPVTQGIVREDDNWHRNSCITSRLSIGRCPEGSHSIVW